MNYPTTLDLDELGKNKRMSVNTVDNDYAAAMNANNEPALSKRGSKSSARSSENTSLTPYEIPVNTYSDDQQILVPDVEDTWFSFRILWAFTGPGFLMSIAYLDPGNIESDLQSGSVGGYKLLWVTLGATILGLILQRLSARLGVVTGLHLAELGYRHYPRIPRLILWIMVEIAIIGSDMQEVIGTSIAIYMLSNRIIPLWAGCLITMSDTLTFLLLDRYGLRKLEAFFCLLILTMGLTFGYEYIVVAPDQGEVMKGMFIPGCVGCNSDALLQAVGMVGAIIMPHNLYLHSALVKSRKVDRTNPKRVVEANKYYFIEASIALFCSFIINTFVVSVFGSQLFQVTNEDQLDKCVAAGNPQGDIFPNNTEYIDADIYKGGVLLGCNFGIACMYIWGVGILAAGQSSTMTGTYAGQFVMEGFLNLQWPRWKRVLVTRLIALFPTLLVACFSGINDMTKLNDYLNSVMSMQLPFALIPTLTFSCSGVIMGDFVSGWFTKIITVFLGVVVIGINLYFVGFNVVTVLPAEWWIYLLTIVFGLLYLAFIAYLTLYLLIVLGVKPLERLVTLRNTDDTQALYPTYGSPLESASDLSHAVDAELHERSSSSSSTSMSPINSPSTDKTWT